MRARPAILVVALPFAQPGWLIKRPDGEGTQMRSLEARPSKSAVSFCLCE